jgi:hypothetical protein
MSVQRIDIDRKHTHGWQARAYIEPGRRLTKLCSDGANGGRRKARAAAKLAEAALKRKARGMKRGEV